MPAPRPIYSLSIDAKALSAGVMTDLLEIRTPATTGIVVVGWWVEFDGVTATNTPVKVEIGRFGAAATTTGTAITPMRVSHGNVSLASQCTCYIGAASVDSTTGVDTEFHRVPPTSGIQMPEALGMEWVMGASGFFRLRAQAAAAVNATCGIRWTE